MSILNKNFNSNMGSSSFHEFKKQASFFFKEKIKTARLALTDVTPAELLVEEATNGNPWSPDSRTMGSISRAAFEVDDYWRIVGILHKRLSKFERKNWRASYNSLVVLEHLLTHGPESVADEFQSDKEAIQDMGSFQHIDERGFNWGLAVRKKSDRVFKLLEKGPLLREERDRSRKLTRGIQGFGSFCQRSSANGILKESSRGTTIERCNSQFNNYENQENQIQPASERGLIQKVEKIQQKNENSKNSSSQGPETQTGLKENMAPNDEELHRWNLSGESNPLIDGSEENRVGLTVEDDHPFNGVANQATASLLSARDGILQGC